MPSTSLRCYTVPPLPMLVRRPSSSPPSVSAPCPPSLSDLSNPHPHPDATSVNMPVFIKDGQDNPPTLIAIRRLPSPPPQPHDNDPPSSTATAPSLPSTTRPPSSLMIAYSRPFTPSSPGMPPSACTPKSSALSSPRTLPPLLCADRERASSLL
ncbi:hypothetical protein ARMGADRAFT_87937 [Armillaria gallica]|uniref:Uncharacterized protein n=1 Tax=Armillaria gallica TaxID=47427 RepID=A0A2H3CP15_ARMGA|nr:hypothetical protein ARMGADRAFT_87937 [Armillaria gallica]